MFRAWTGYWGGALSSQQPVAARIQPFQKKWADTMADLIKKQQGSLEAQFQAGLKVIEGAFGITGAKNPEEVRTKVIDCWKAGFDCLRRTVEMQLEGFQAIVAKGAELAANPEA
jgi:hypothetical protein